jgi:hypothetical protein
MKKLTTVIFVFSIFIALTAMVLARSHRPNQVPNGTKFSCLTCHAVPSPLPGNGPRNPFGQKVEADFLDMPGSEGNVEWGPNLAILDSDGDGVTNGAELGDPDGLWSIGQSNPGNLEDITNPGDASSVSAIRISTVIPNEFRLEQNYPNPFNPTTSIEFAISELARVRITVFNLQGQITKILVDEILSAGQYSTYWDGTNQYNIPVSSGTYLYVFQSGINRQMKKMTLIR